MFTIRDIFEELQNLNINVSYNSIATRLKKKYNVNKTAGGINLIDESIKGEIIQYYKLKFKQKD